MMALLRRDPLCLAAGRAVLGRRLAPYGTGSNRNSVGKLNHIAIATKDASGHVAFYRHVLGLSVGERQAQPEHGVYTTFIDFGNTKVELLEPYGEDGPIGKFVERNPKGAIHHICYEVDDLEAMVKHLQAQGITPLSPPKIGAHGNPVVFLHPKDCHGVLTELEEVPRKRQ